jgi:hypothetical protein
MKKGIVMEMDESFLTLLTPEGEFLHARRQNQSYAIGEEIHFFPIEKVKTTNSLIRLKKIFLPKPVMGIMAALVIFLGSLIPMYQNNKAYAYMSIDVNPSIELGVNKKMQVVEITGFNQEGKQIISHLTDWEKKDVSELAKFILVEIEKEGYFDTKEQVIISTVRTTDPEVKVEKELQATIEEIKETVKKQKVEVTVLKSTEQEMEKAHKRGLTTGKYHEKKMKDSKLLTSKEQTKEKQIGKKAASLSPKDQISASQQSDKGLSPKNKEMKNNKKTELDRVDGKFIPPGQKKKVEEKQLEQNPVQHKKPMEQKEKKEKKSEAKKTKSKSKVNQKSNVKPKSKVSKEQKRNKQNSSLKSKDQTNKKAFGKNQSNQKNN